MPKNFDAVIVGAGASGLMYAARAGKRNKRGIVLDSGPKPGPPKSRIMDGATAGCSVTTVQQTSAIC